MCLQLADRACIYRMLSGVTQGAADDRSALVVGCVKEVLLRRREDLRSFLIIPLGIRKVSTRATRATDERHDYPDVFGVSQRGSKGLLLRRHRPPTPLQRSARALPSEPLFGDIEAASFHSPWQFRTYEATSYVPMKPGYASLRDLRQGSSRLAKQKRRP